MVSALQHSAPPGRKAKIERAQRAITMVTASSGRRERAGFVIVLAVVLALLTECVWAGDSARPPAGCSAIVDASHAPSSREATWIMRVDAGERRRLDEQCEAVGPIVLRMPPARNPPSSPEDVAIVGWNVHVGGGDIVRLVEQLKSGALTGHPVSHYVLLLQEAHRAGGGMRELPRDVRAPGRIAPRTSGRTREDILSVANRLDAALYYVPSMRNGAEPPFEDRGNAILSTLPLEDLLAIELPFTRQRRIAIGAMIRGGAGAAAWRLRVVALHLDALAGASRLWIFASGWRATQAKTALAALDQREPSVLGGDLNTWFLGSWERAYKRIEDAYPETRTTIVPEASTKSGRLDYIFLRLPPGLESRTWRPNDPCGTGQPKCGSDHRPIVSIFIKSSGPCCRRAVS
jgi:endonuclease/exonuclease/phosphatase family metal-dependent hydrolase